MTGWTDIGATNPPEASVDNLTGSDGAHGAAGARQDSISKAPDPEVVVKPQRRRFTAEYKERILEEVDACKHGELGALLRREGLHDSTVRKWRAARDAAIAQALAGGKPGPVPKEPNPLEEENARLRRELQRVREELSKARVIIDVQKKSRSCWHRARWTRTARRPNASRQATRNRSGRIRRM